jgi:hypothetical protein
MRVWASTDRERPRPRRSWLGTGLALVGIPLVLPACDAAEAGACAHADGDVDLVGVVSFLNGSVFAGAALADASADDYVAQPLCDDERLEVNGVVLEGTDDPGYYASEVDVADSFDLVWVRDDGTRHTLTSDAPLDFTIDAPAASTSIPRTSLFSVAWSPPRDGEEIALRVEADVPGCVQPLDEVVPDSGSWSLVAGTIEAAADDPNAVCDASLSLERSVWVEGDAGFLAGNSLLLVTREWRIGFQSVP